MGVSLSIKDVPEALAERLRRRAVANHRSLQRELMAIVEAAVAPERHATPVQPTGPLRSVAALEIEGHYAVTVHESRAGAEDDLLAELDTIVAGSRWGSAPLLTREQAHERALARELDFDARAAELAEARRAGCRGGAA